MAQAKHLTSEAARLAANMSFTKAAGVAATANIGHAALLVSHDGAQTAVVANAALALAALAASDLPSSMAQWKQPSGTTGFYSHPTAASLGVASVTVYYVFGVTAAGTVKVVQGTYDNQALPNGAVGKSVIPDVPSGNFTPVTVMRIVSTAAFVPGTTTTAAVSTFKDVAVLPVGSTF